MERQNPTALQVESWLKELGVEWLRQWDTLVFLYRHHASLASAEHVAQLLGYSTNEVVAALDSLESLSLVKRSRVSQGVRLYEFAAPDDSRRGDHLDRLMALAYDRAGRLFLAKALRRGGPTNHNDGAPRSRGPERTGTWLKVI